MEPLNKLFYALFNECHAVSMLEQKNTHQHVRIGHEDLKTHVGYPIFSTELLRKLKKKNRKNEYYNFVIPNIRLTI